MSMARPERFELPTAGFEDQNSSTELRTDGALRRMDLNHRLSVINRLLWPLSYTGMHGGGMVESNSNRSRSPSVFKTVLGPAQITLHCSGTPASIRTRKPPLLRGLTLPICPQGYSGATDVIRTRGFQDLQSRALGLSATVACVLSPFLENGGKL